MIEIRFHGLGGQGVVLAGKLLASGAANAGYHTQAFAAYGAERRGAKVESFVRLSDNKINIHSKVYRPDYVIIMDEALAVPETLSGLKEGGWVLINSSALPAAFSLGDFKIFTIDANYIAADEGLRLTTGVSIINTAMLGAVAAMIDQIEIEHLEQVITGKIPSAEKNLNAARSAYCSLKSQSIGGLADEGIKEQNKTVSIIKQFPTYIRKLSPCQSSCPVGNDIPRMIYLIQQNQFEEALQSVKSENPFPGICGRVCSHPCEINCNRNEHDEGIAISALERATSDYANKGKVSKPKQERESGKRVAIIGSGPGGMSCAYFLLKLGHKSTVFESLSVPGGIPRVGIPAYRLPRAVTDSEIDEIIKLGIDIKLNTEVGRDIFFEDIRQQYDACFIAIGANHPMKMDIPGEDCESVILGLDFLKGTALGKKMNIGEKVVVIGGGNTAIDAARTAKRLGAEEIYLLSLESKETVPAYSSEVRAAKQEGIKMLHCTMVVQIEKRETLLELECIKVRSGRRDKKGWFKWPEPVKDSNFTMNADTIIVAIGATTEGSFLPDSIQRDRNLISVDYLGKTSLEGVYAGGDSTMLAGSVAEAIASGKRSALGMDMFLRRVDEKPVVKAAFKEDVSFSMQEYLEEEYDGRVNAVVSLADLSLEYLPKLPCTLVPELPVQARVGKFDEVNIGFTRTEAVNEADRCLHCGHCTLCGNCYIFCPEIAVSFDEITNGLVINQELCKICEICIQECPSNVISLER